jgi:hypothetical protein
MDHHRDLVCQLILSLEEATAGCSKTVVYQRPLPGGSSETCQVQLSIPAGTPNGTQARFKGRGLPGLGSLPSGDLYLRISLHPDETNPSESSTLFEQPLAHEPALLPITGAEALPASDLEVSTFLEQLEPDENGEFELEELNLASPTPSSFTFPYEVKELIGQGGMGLVHRVYHRRPESGSG